MLRKLVQVLKKPVVLGAIAGWIGGTLTTLLVLASGWFSPVEPQPETHWGEFLSSAQMELLDNGRQARLLKEFVYLDKRNRQWIAPEDWIVDGASIPQSFWSITGGPLEGRYRNASIVHDAACDRKDAKWHNVHLMFYEACRCGGLPEDQAKVLYAAVYHFGPRWEVRQLSEQRIGPDGKPYPVWRPMTFDLTKEPPDEKTREKLKRFIAERNPTLEQIQAIDPDSL